MFRYVHHDGFLPKGTRKQCQSRGYATRKGRAGETEVMGARLHLWRSGLFLWPLALRPALPWACMRYPSYLISCSQSSAAGASSTRSVSCGLVHFGGRSVLPTMAAHPFRHGKSPSGTPTRRTTPRRSAIRKPTASSVCHSVPDHRPSACNTWPARPRPPAHRRVCGRPGLDSR